MFPFSKRAKTLWITLDEDLVKEASLNYLISRTWFNRPDVPTEEGLSNYVNFLIERDLKKREADAVITKMQRYSDPGNIGLEEYITALIRDDLKNRATGPNVS